MIDVIKCCFRTSDSLLWVSNFVFLPVCVKDIDTAHAHASSQTDEVQLEISVHSNARQRLITQQLRHHSRWLTRLQVWSHRTLRTALGVQERVCSRVIQSAIFCFCLPSVATKLQYCVHSTAQRNNDCRIYGMITAVYLPIDNCFQ